MTLLASQQAANLAVLRGTCSTPEVRALDSGARLASLALRVPRGDDGATSVPVAIWDPPAWVDGLVEGEELVVVGHVRRRFFRTAAGQRGARVEVEADHVVRAGERRRVATAVRRAQRALDALDP